MCYIEFRSRAQGLHFDTNILSSFYRRRSSCYFAWRTWWDSINNVIFSEIHPRHTDDISLLSIESWTFTECPWTCRRKQEERLNTNETKLLTHRITGHRILPICFNEQNFGIAEQLLYLSSLLCIVFFIALNPHSLFPNCTCSASMLSLCC